MTDWLTDSTSDLIQKGARIFTRADLWKTKRKPTADHWRYRAVGLIRILWMLAIAAAAIFAPPSPWLLPLLLLLSSHKSRLWSALSILPMIYNQRQTRRRHCGPHSLTHSLSQSVTFASPLSFLAGTRAKNQSSSSSLLREENPLNNNEAVEWNQREQNQRQYVCCEICAKKCELGRRSKAAPSRGRLASPRAADEVESSHFELVGWLGENNNNRVDNLV